MKSIISLKNINKLAIPALIAGMVEPFLSITDTAIVGHMDLDATPSLAAAGIVGAFISMLIWILGQTRSAISSIVSQYLGAGKLEEVKSLPAQAILLVVLLSFLLMGITYPFATAIFEFYNASGLVLNYAVEYYRIRVIGFPFTLFTFAIFGTFRGLQNTYFPMIIALVGALVNIFLDYILVYGIDGYIEAYHLAGAGYASVLAQVIMALLSLYYLIKKTSIPLRFTLPWHKETPRLVSMMINLFFRTLALNLALYFGMSYATSYGTKYTAAYTMGLQLWFLGAFIIDGYASAGNILSGKLLGAKEYGLLNKLSKKLVIYGLLVGGLLMLFGGIFYTGLGQLFSKDSEVLTAFYKTFWLVLVMQPFCAIAFIFDGMYKGMGKMGLLRNLLLVATLVVFIPSLLLMDFWGYELYAIWTAFFLWIIFRGGVLSYDFRKRYGKFKNA